MTFPTRAADWLTFEEARGRIIASARPGVSETVSVSESVGRALANAVVATTALPPWDNSAMDGYAARSTDLDQVDADSPLTLKVVGESRPGSAWEGEIGPGEAVRIMTGAPVPAGADCVVRVEHTQSESSDSVLVLRSDDRGRNVRPAGEDMEPGDLVMDRGIQIGAGQVAALASIGHTTVDVFRRPNIGILTTGDELVSPDEFEAVLAGRAIVDSNGPMLAEQVREAGGVPTLLGPARDDVEDLRERLRPVEGMDVLITVGGASMGTHDLVKRVLDDAGFDLDFWRVRIRPGSPFSFGRLPTGETAIPVFGLPGNPGSAFVTFEMFARPFIRTAAGYATVERMRLQATAMEDIRAPEDLTVFLRVVVDERNGGFEARLTGPQGSGLVSGLAVADGLAVIPVGTDHIPSGGPVDVVLLRAP